MHCEKVTIIENGGAIFLLHKMNSATSYALLIIFVVF